MGGGGGRRGLLNGHFMLSGSFGTPYNRTGYDHCQKLHTLFYYSKIVLTT